MSKKPDLPEYNWSQFGGYAYPNTTPVPDELLDHQLPYLSGGELKVLLYIIRKTRGYKKTADHLSFDHIRFGSRRRDTGEPWDRGTGLSRSTLITAVRLLEEKGLITVRREPTESGDAEINLYSLREEPPRGGGG